MDRVKEICVESFAEATKAMESGATRIELCENLSQGGTTPSYGTIKKCIEKLDVPVMVMIRPRGGDFVYSSEEFEIMRDDVRIAKVLGATGVVFGILTDEKEIDRDRTRELLHLARPMQVTFHKAIDELKDIFAGLTWLKEEGIERVLSSGGRLTALEGQNTLNQMIELAGPRLKIIVAGKVTHENFDEIQEKILNCEYHGRRLVKF